MPFFTLQEGSPWVALELAVLFRGKSSVQALKQQKEGGKYHVYFLSEVFGSLGRLNNLKSSESSSLVCILCIISKVNNFMAQLNASPLQYKSHESRYNIYSTSYSQFQEQCWACSRYSTNLYWVIFGLINKKQML